METYVVENLMAFKTPPFAVALFTSSLSPAAFAGVRTFEKECDLRVGDWDGKTTSLAAGVHRAKMLLVDEKGADYAG